MPPLSFIKTNRYSKSAEKRLNGRMSFLPAASRIEERAEKVLNLRQKDLNARNVMGSFSE
jgi:hypothetical protein